MLLPLILLVALVAGLQSASPAAADDVYFGAPGNVVATAGSLSATVTWTAADNPGNDLYAYAITPYVGSTPGSTVYVTVGNPLTKTFTGLTNGTTYTFSVVGVGWFGDPGPSTTSNGVTVGSVPNAPTGLAAGASVVGGDGHVALSWSAPSGNGSAITGYTITPSSGSSVSVSGSTTSTTLTGVSAGARSYTVKATNAWGNSANSSSTNVTVPEMPSAPSGLTAIAGNGDALVSWTAATTHPELVTCVTVQAYAGGVATDGYAWSWASGSGGYVVVDGLTNGTAYTFRAVFYTGWCENSTAESSASSAVTPFTATSVPNAPSSVSATATSGGNASVSWVKPSGYSTAAVTGYTATASPGGATATADRGATTAYFSGLTLGTAYTFTVKATNSVGNSAASSASNSATSGSAPSTPSAPTAGANTVVDGQGSVTVNWSAPASNGSAITGYTVTPSSGSAVTVSGSTTSYTFSAAPGTSLSATVRATNAWGTSAASAASGSATVNDVPSAPRNVTAYTGNGSATVSWDSPSTNPNYVWGYLVTPYAGSVAHDELSQWVQDSSAQVTGLTNGTAYTFKVQATTWFGDSGAWSSASSAVTPYVPTATPSAPSGASATASAGGYANVTFTGSSNASTTAIDHYTVTASPGGATRTVNAVQRTAQFSGLTSGTAYTFSVTATNSVGTSSASSASNSITSGTAPSAPSTPTVSNNGVSDGAGSVQVDWTAPSSNGSAITGYTITPSSGSPVTVSSSTTTYVFGGLTPGGSYTFTVKATNAWGTSAASSASSSVTLNTVPSAPLSVTAVAGNGSATVSWSEPASRANEAWGYWVVPYVGSVAHDELGAWVQDYTTVVPDLTNGTAYTFKVQAYTWWGDSGAFSAASSAVTPHS